MNEYEYKRLLAEVKEFEKSGGSKHLNGHMEG